jgi:hypothetical protein
MDPIDESTVTAGDYYARRTFARATRPAGLGAPAALAMFKACESCDQTGR